MSKINQPPILLSMISRPEIIAQDWLSALFSFFKYPFQHSNAEQAKILWLVKLRWLAITLFIVFGSIGYAAGLMPLHQFPIYIGVIGLIIPFNLFAQVFFGGQSQSVAQVTLCLHMAFDLAILTVMLYLTRGVENPFIGLFFLHASLGGLLIPGYLTLPFIFLIHTAVTFLQLDYISSIPGAPTSKFALVWMVVFHILLFGFWLVMRSLGHYLEKQNENQIRLRLLSETQDRLRAVGALTAGFSHEFASPLNTAKVRLERAKKTIPIEDIEEALKAIESCERVLHQMNDSQLDARSYIQKPAPIHELIFDVVETWKEDHAVAKVELKIKNIGIQPIAAVNFAQVILNLLDNAYREKPDGRILVELEQRESFISFSIQDEGPGYPEIVLKRLGEPFLTTKADGTGLGLYVSHLFVQSLGGELRLFNGKKSKGAKVELRWPMSEAHHA